MTDAAANDRLDRLYAVVDRYARRYPEQHHGPGYLTHAIEELLHTLLGLVRVYSAESDLDEVIAREFSKVMVERRDS